MKTKEEKEAALDASLEKYEKLCDAQKKVLPITKEAMYDHVLDGLTLLFNHKGQVSSSLTFGDVVIPKEAMHIGCKHSGHDHNVEVEEETFGFVCDEIATGRKLKYHVRKGLFDSKIGCFFWKDEWRSVVDE